MQWAMKADTEAVIDIFGKNEQVKKLFWTQFVTMAGLVLTRVVDRLPISWWSGYEDGGEIGGTQEMRVPLHFFHQ